MVEMKEDILKETYIYYIKAGGELKLGIYVNQAEKDRFFEKQRQELIEEIRRDRENNKNPKKKNKKKGRKGKKETQQTEDL